MNSNKKLINQYARQTNPLFPITNWIIWLSNSYYSISFAFGNLENLRLNRMDIFFWFLEQPQTFGLAVIIFSLGGFTALLWDAGNETNS